MFFHILYAYLKKKTFCGFSMGRNQYWAGRVYDLCVYYMMGTPEGSTESGFMEKPGIEPATPGLQGIELIHYTTGAYFMGESSTFQKSWTFQNQILKLAVCLKSVNNFKYKWSIAQRWTENKSEKLLKSV